MITIASFFTLVAAKTGGSRVTATLYLVLFALWGALWTFGKCADYYCLKKAFRTQERQLNGQQMNITASGIAGNATDGSVTYSYKWSAFESFIELPGAFLLLPNAASFVRIPKDNLSLEDQENIRQWRLNQ